MANQTVMDSDENFEELSLLMGDENHSVAVDCSSSSPLQAKYIVPVHQTCRICGEWINNSQDWLSHHLSEKHKKVICCLALFRSKCIEHHNDAAEPTMKAIANGLRQKVQFTQELFEAPLTSNLVCGVCGACVFDVENHLSSIKHNEAYINLLYLEDFVAVKEKCITLTGVCGREFEKNIILRLQQNQPRTDDSPLEIYVLKDDEDFKEWMWKYMIALSNYTQPKDFHLSYINTLELIAPANVSGEKTIDESILFRNDCCLICRSKHFSLDSFKKHASTESHVQKLKLFDFLRFADKFKLISGMCSEQNRIDSSTEPTLGSECVTEFRDKFDQKSFWICSVCFVVSEDIDEIVTHMSSTKHLTNCLNSFYSDIKLTSKNSKLIGEEVKRYVRQIQVNRSPGKIRLAELVDARMDTLFVQFGVARKPDVELSSTNSSNVAVSITDLENSVPEDEKEPKVLLSGRNEDVLWCDACSVMIPVKKTEVGTKVFWWQHVTTKSHLEKKEIRKEFEFEKKNFVSENLAANIREACAKKDLTLLGLENIIERKIKTKDGMPVHDCVCLLCAEKFHVSTFTSHVTSKQHVLQFLHKNEQNLAQKIVSERQTDVQLQKIIDEYVATKKSVREAVRVYNPARADQLAAEYDRLKQEIAEKERILEQKRKEKEKEEEERRRFAEIKRLADLEIQNKKLEDARVVELKRKEIERLAEEEKKRAMQEKALAQMEKVKEDQQKKARQKMEQQRLLDMMQREQQKMKEQEKAKVEQKRILDLMIKEKAKIDEDEKKTLEKDTKIRKERESKEKLAEQGKLIAGALNITKILPSANKPATGKAAATPAAPSNVQRKSGEPKWVPLSQTETQRIVIPPKADLASANVSKPLVQNSDAPDVLIELLSKSAMLPIIPPDVAYIHKDLIICPEPLVGLQHVNEFECLDVSFEPGYFCRMCSTRRVASELIPHVVSSEHRMKYFEQSYNPFWQNIMMTYTNVGARAAVIKQYAGQVERQEGRKKIEFRLTMRVSNTVLNIKKLMPYKNPDVSAANFTVPPPINVQYYASSLRTVPMPLFPPVSLMRQPPPLFPQQQQTLGVVNMDICPPGISPPMPTNEYNPIVFSTAPAPVPPPVVVSEQQKSAKHNKQKNENSSDPRDASWDDKCNKFLQKLTGQEGSKTTSVSKESAKNDKKTSDSSVSRKNRSRSRSRSRSKSVDRRSKTSSKHQSSSSPAKKSSSTKTTPSAVKKNSDTKYTKIKEKSTDVSVAKRNRSRSPGVVDKRLRNSVGSNPPPANEDIALLSAEDILVLQKLAETDPQLLERLILENPSIMAALLIEQSKSVAPKPVAPAQPPVYFPQQFSVPQSTASFAPVQSMTSASTLGLENLFQQLVGQQQQPQQPLFGAQQMQQQMDPNAMLMNLFQEEMAKLSKAAAAADEQRLLMALLQMTGGGNKDASAIMDQMSTVGPSVAAPSSSKRVYDYSHRHGVDGGGDHQQQQQQRAGVGKALEIDDLIKEASANVQQAQQSGKRVPPSASMVARQPIYNSPIVANRQVEETAERWRELANDQSFFMPKPPTAPSVIDSQQRLLSMQRQQQQSGFDQQQQEKVKEAERRRKELLENLANELMSYR